MNRLNIKQRLITILAFLALIGILGLMVMLSGIVPVSASGGHWTITKQILKFSKQRSVATYSSGIEVPELEDPSKVLKGAGHFETGCIQCHGSPTQPRSPIALSMTATPPSLPSRIGNYEPQELFYIVKHGIKMTGMPAWPARERDDEVWAIIAFLLKLPQMEEEQYRELVHQNPPEKTKLDNSLPAALWEACRRCHGRDGLGRGEGAFPRLAGQHQEYLLQSMQAYAKGARHSGMMQPVTAILDESTLKVLAEHYANLPAGLGTSREKSNGGSGKDSDASSPDSASIDRGKTIAHEGVPDRDIPSCIDCHGPSEFLVADSYPLLSGQYKNYLVLQLRLFKSQRRGGTEQLELMQPVVENMTEQDIEDVAAYYASLGQSTE